MPKQDFSTKRMQIDKTNVIIVAAVATAAFVTIFSLIAVKTLWGQSSYQRRVIHARETARDQLEANIKSADTLASSYQQFISSSENSIGGSATGTGERDGDNARIILDALPSKYDFPALTTSLEKLVKSQSLTISEISGIDDELNQSKTSDTPTPVAVEMPFKLAVKGNYDGIQNLVNVFEHSIRPFSMIKVEFQAATGGDVILDIEAKTFYQPEKGLKFNSEVVK